MRILTTAILASGLLFGTAGFANAQLGGLLGGDKVTDTVLNQATGAVAGQANTSVLGQGSSVLGNSAPGSLTSSTLSGSESITAGRVILGGGSTTDAAVAVGRSRVNSQVSGLTGGITGGTTGTSALGTITGEPSSSSNLLGGLTGSTPAPSSSLGGLVGGGASSSVLGDITGSNKKAPTSLLGGLVGN